MSPARAEPVVLPAAVVGREAPSRVGPATRLAVLAAICVVVLAVVVALSLVAWVAVEVV